MKRYRVKAIGLGLALCGGALRGAEDPPAIPIPMPPAMLPPSVRPAEWISSPTAVDTVWRSVRPPVKKVESPKVEAVVPAIALPQKAVPTPQALPVAPPRPAPREVVAEAAPAVEPNLRGLPGGPIVIPIPQPNAPSKESTRTAAAQPAISIPKLPAIPTPGVATAPSRVAPLPSRVAAAPSRGSATPTIVAPLPLLPAASPAPHSPATFPLTASVNQPVPTLPQPRLAPPLIPPAREFPDSPPRPPREQELPTAPPELMVPEGLPVPGKYGTFGSPNIRISKDLPSVREMLNPDGSGYSGWWDRWLSEFRGSSNNAPSPMATDRLQFAGEYLLWSMNPQNIPVLGTTSVNGGFGFLGDPGTQSLLGPGPFGNSLRSGMRLRAGYWFDDCGTWGVGGSFFFLGRQTTTQAFSSANTPTITRPFFAPNFPAEFGEIVALPGLSDGVLTVNATSSLWGLDANVRRALCKTCEFRSEVFFGYRFLDLRESLTINETLLAVPGNPTDPAGTHVSVTDSFRTQNLFNGAQVGYAAERIWGRFSLSGRGSLALGDTSQSLDIAGSQMRLRPGMTTPDVFNGGLLATGPNLGHFQSDHFSVVPEVTFNVGYWITPTIRAYVGYNFLFWSNVIRPGDQIDRVVNASLVPNPPAGVPFSDAVRPMPTFHQTDLVVNGIQFGLMGRW